MKSIWVTIICCITSFIVLGQTNQDIILGKWITETNNCIVDVHREGSEFKATVVWFDVKAKQPMNEWYDVKNPNKALRNRKLVGMEVLNGLHYNTENNEWVGGQIYDATTGKKWDSVVWIDKNNALKVKGFWLFRWLCETRTFRRVK